MPSIFIIDDDVDMLSSLTDVLSHAGYQVNGVESGRAALQLAETTSLDLIITDIRMPDMDGIQCIEVLSMGRPNLKSIVITGYAGDDVPGRAMDVSTCDYLRKPFTAEQLLLSVGRALAASEEPSGAPAVMAQTGAALGEMEAIRRRAFLNFYLGVRSGHLVMVAALAIWDILEEVELHRLELEKQLRLRLEVTELKDRYLTVSEHCKSPAASGLLTQARGSGRLSKIAFQPFFKNIRDGKLSCDQLKVAVAARQRAQEQVNDHDQELFRLIWT